MIRVFPCVEIKYILFFLIFLSRLLPVCPAESLELDSKLISSSEGTLSFAGRMRLENGAWGFSAAGTVDRGGYAGHNLTFSSQNLYGGSLNPQGLIKEILIPSLLRDIPGGAGTAAGFTLDRSICGTSRRGGVLQGARGGTGFFLIGKGTLISGFSGGQAGFWSSLNLKSFQPEITALLSRSSGKDHEAWFSDKRQYSSGHSGHLGVLLPWETSFFKVSLLSLGSFGYTDPPGGLFKANIQYGPSFLSLLLQGSWATPNYQAPPGEGIKEKFAWSALLDLHPVEWGAMKLSGYEIQETLPVFPAACRSFRSRGSAEFLLTSGKKRTSFTLFLHQKGDVQGIIYRKRGAELGFVLEERSWCLSGEGRYTLSDGGWGESANFKIKLGTGIKKDSGSFQTSLGLIRDQGNVSLGGTAEWLVRQDGCRYNLKLESDWNEGTSELIIFISLYCDVTILSY